MKSFMRQAYKYFPKFKWILAKKSGIKIRQLSFHTQKNERNFKWSEYLWWYYEGMSHIHFPALQIRVRQEDTE